MSERPPDWPAWLRPPEPGERCFCCGRRKNKPRQDTTPESRKVRAGELPNDRADALEEALDALQENIGADSTSYPRGTVLELLALLGGQHREVLRDYFQGAA